nr:SQSTM1 [Halisarca dujardinii]
MEVSSPITVKAFLYRKWGEDPIEIRRFSLDTSQPVQFQAFTDKVASIFSQLSEDNFKLHWIDGDGDRIVISSDEELSLALPASSRELFRVHVQLLQPEDKSAPPPLPSSSSSSSSRPAASEEGVTHPGVLCDGCEGAIRGVRYKCLSCPDYDLCSTCERKGLHPDHNMAAYHHPLPPTPFGLLGLGFPFMSHLSSPPHSSHCPPRFGRGGCGRGFHGRGRGYPSGCRGARPSGCRAQWNSEQQDAVRNIVEHCSTFLRPYGVTVDAKFESPQQGKSEENPATKPEPAHPQSDPMQEEEGTSPAPSDEDIAKVAEQLQAMGFDNSGGWLSELVRSRGADLQRVLEVLHPEQ